MMKLTQKEASLLYNQARKDVQENPYLRLGQAIWNLLPDVIASTYVTTEYDFFYEEYDDVVEEIFFNSDAYIDYKN